MLNIIKRNIPKPIKTRLVALKNKFQPLLNKNLMNKMQRQHYTLTQKLKSKEKIRVVFLVIHKSVWKVDSVYKKMSEHPLFEPLIVVCPDIAHGDEHMWSEMNTTYNYFNEKKYSLVSAYNQEKKEWLKLDSLNPDIIFFTNPHKLTYQEYYEDAYLNYLSCYVPYHHEIVNNPEQFNQQFHIAQWKIFSTNESAVQLYKNYYPRYGDNVILVGYPAMEELIDKINNNTYADVWKTNDGRLRVIWAPHHSIEMNKNVPYSNFIQHAHLFQELSNKYKDKIIWSFKPHPLLKIKLYEMPHWGKKITDEYYEYWKNNEYSQLEQGEYIDLFCSSDVMIHDSGSFLAEYLYMKKPVLFNLSPINNGEYYSDFGLDALNSCFLGKTEKDIITFLESNLSISMRKIAESHTQFLNKNVVPFFSKEKPSDLIIKSILDSYYSR